MRLVASYPFHPPTGCSSPKKTLSPPAKYFLDLAGLLRLRFPRPQTCIEEQSALEATHFQVHSAGNIRPRLPAVLGSARYFATALTHPLCSSPAYCSL